MRFGIFAVLLLSVLAFQTVSADNLCPKYATSLNYTSQLNFMTNWVNKLYNKAVAADSYTVQYFDASENGTYVDYTTNVTAAIELITAWVEYFASVQPFKCTDGSIDPYTNTQTLDEIHEGMPIDIYATKEFNQDVLDVLTDVGFSDSDISDVSDWLDSLFDQICNVNCVEYSAAFSLNPSIVIYSIGVVLALFL